ncbi:hypothetical protein NDU88_008059 [Pleurodeles waltl]|uniref:Uncharacterized protein n=1 Tax=Pleurodeles waltl TaxID=8319 RepID=A0AAV7NY43_PLEWA|nr:hypothetical protein NDU88_008059 [Pleurodeles waltl]
MENQQQRGPLLALRAGAVAFIIYCKLFHGDYLPRRTPDPAVNQRLSRRRGLRGCGSAASRAPHAPKCTILGLSRSDGLRAESSTPPELRGPLLVSCTSRITLRRGIFTGLLCIGVRETDL